MPFIYQNLLKRYELLLIPPLKYAHTCRGKKAKQWT